MRRANARGNSKVGKEFKRLAAEYRQDTGNLADGHLMASHQAYRAIVAMGRPAVPFLLRELQQNPDSWFVALSMITKAKPEKSSDFPDPHKRAEAWLRWGRQHGYIR